MDTQRIQFVTNVDDLVDAYERYWRRAPAGRTQRRRGTIGVAASFAASVFVTAWVLGGVSRSLVVPLAGIALLLGAASWPLSRYLYDSSLRRRLRRVLTQEAGERTSWLCEVELRDEGVWARGRGIESLYDWRELTWLEDDGDTIEFHFRGSFVMVRARAFAGPSERETFLDAARDLSAWVGRQ
jgi:hypothetical protein